MLNSHSYNQKTKDTVSDTKYINLKCPLINSSCHNIVDLTPVLINDHLEVGGVQYMANRIQHGGESGVI